MIKEYNLTNSTIQSFLHHKNSPAFKVGHDWRADEDDFVLWYEQYKHDIGILLDKHTNKEIRLIVNETDSYNRVLYRSAWLIT